MLKRVFKKGKKKGRLSIENESFKHIHNLTDDKENLCCKIREIDRIREQIEFYMIDREAAKTKAIPEEFLVDYILKGEVPHTFQGDMSDDVIAEEMSVDDYVQPYTPTNNLESLVQYLVKLGKRQFKVIALLLLMACLDKTKEIFKAILKIKDKILPELDS